MKLLAGIALFILCALMGERRARWLQRREQALSKFHELIRRIGDRQLSGLVSFSEAALGCPPSKEREELLKLSRGEGVETPLLTGEETARLLAYARSESRSVEALRSERDALLVLLEQERDRTKEEWTHKGQLYRSVGYLCGAAALLLVL